MSYSGPRTLVTGASGCIGAWTIRRLLADGARVVALDLGADRSRLELVAGTELPAGLAWEQADITDAAALERVIDEHAITSIIHLAALQIPFCRAEPALGASVNLVGTVNVLEAVRRRADRMGPLVYASSIAAHPAPGGEAPSSLYGVYKRAVEGCAEVYWNDHAVPSVGLRPHTVYGLGRDQGLTSAPTTAMRSAAAGRPFTIPFSGRLTFQHGAEVADAFVAAARADVSGAPVCDLPGHTCGMDELVTLIEAAAPAARGLLSVAGEPLGLPADTDSSELPAIVGPLPRVDLAEGVRETVARFAALHAKPPGLARSRA